MPLPASSGPASPMHIRRLRRHLVSHRRVNHLSVTQSRRICAASELVSSHGSKVKTTIDDTALKAYSWQACRSSSPSNNAMTPYTKVAADLVDPRKTKKYREPHAQRIDASGLEETFSSFQRRRGAPSSKRPESSPRNHVARRSPLKRKTDHPYRAMSSQATVPRRRALNSYQRVSIQHRRA